MRRFHVGETYRAVLNGKERSFTVLPSHFDSPDYEYVIRWDDGEEEAAYAADMERWIMEADPLYKKEDRRGGRREGAGRPSIGVSKAFKLTLDQAAWDWLDQCVENGHANSRSDLLRRIIDHARGK